MARREWGWLRTNPVNDVHRTVTAAARTRRPIAEETRKLLDTLGYLQGTVFDVMELARIGGHRDLRVLHNVYYAPSVSDLAAKLD